MKSNKCFIISIKRNDLHKKLKAWKLFFVETLGYSLIWIPWIPGRNTTGGCPKFLMKMNLLALNYNKWLLKPGNLVKLSIIVVIIMLYSYSMNKYSSQYKEIEEIVIYELIPFTLIEHVWNDGEPLLVKSLQRKCAGSR